MRKKKLMSRCTQKDELEKKIPELEKELERLDKERDKLLRPIGNLVNASVPVSNNGYDICKIDFHILKDLNISGQ